jgi:hypothetical protein
MSHWKPLSGRVGLVASAPTASGAVSVLALYRQAWGVDPQNFQQAPNPLMASSAQGLHATMLASCTLASNRVDFSLTPYSGSQLDAEPQLHLIDDASAFYAELLRVSTAIGAGKIEVPPEFDRPAIFVQFASIESSVTEANRVLSGAIPEKYRPKLEDEGAFALQLNRPLTVRYRDDVTVNFLTKWSVEQFQVVSFGVQSGGVSGGSAQPGMLTPKVQVFIGACLTFDCHVAAPAGFVVPQGVRLLGRDQQAATFVDALRLVSDSQHALGLNMEGFPNDKSIQH